VKVIFIEDVPNVARAGEAKEVADGYGRNYLLPRKLAVLANSQASAVVEAQLKKIALKRAQEESEMAELAAKLNGVELTLKAKVGEKDRLYGSITGADIADELSSRTGLVVDKKKVELEEPIRQLGTYEVTVRFTHDIAAVIGLTVVAEKVAEEKEEKKEEKREGKKAKAKAKAAKKPKEKAEEAVEEAKAEKGAEETAEAKVAEVEGEVEEAKAEKGAEETAEAEVAEIEEEVEEAKAEKESEKGE
jgi:large subunit ribosomal protein L9